MDLLPWFRLLDAAEVGWDRTTRAAAPGFSRWFQAGGRQYRGAANARGACGQACGRRLDLLVLGSP
jgi:hypothetical protein